MRPRVRDADWGALTVPTWGLVDGVAWRADTARAVAFATRGAVSTPYSMSGTALTLWKLIAESGAVSTQALISAAAAIYDCSTTEIGDEVAAFLGDLESKGLIELSGETAND